MTHREASFGPFLDQQVLPLMARAVNDVRQQGLMASYRKTLCDGHAGAEIIIVPAGLPNAALPPRFTISAAADGERPVNIDITGTFPKAGASGGFGAEVEFDTVYRSQIEEQLLRFVTMATVE